MDATLTHTQQYSNSRASIGIRSDAGKFKSVNQTDGELDVNAGF